MVIIPPTKMATVQINKTIPMKDPTGVPSLISHQAIFAYYLLSPKPEKRKWNRVTRKDFFLSSDNKGASL